jgi:7-cyano-7-deazaguanine synthase
VRKPVKTLVLLSGGLDSTVLLHECVARGGRVAAVSFDYGSKHNRRELACAARQCRRLRVPHTVMALGFIGRFFRSHLLRGGGRIPAGHYADATMRQTVVPFRNGIMLAAAAGLAESLAAREVAIAAHGGDHAIYPDCRPAFLAAMAGAFRLGTYGRIRLLSPYVKCRKSDLVARGLRLGVRFADTWSCYRGGERHCGVCGTCVERREAFRLAGVPDPTRYARNPARRLVKPCA